MPAFYEVREPEITFELPWYVYNLPSGDDILATCGAKNYAITVTSAYTNTTKIDVAIVRVLSTTLVL